MDSRRTSARLSRHPQQELASLESEHKLRKSVKSGNGSKLTGQQPTTQAAPAPACTNSATSTDEGAAQSISDEQQTQQPLEAFISIIETYFGPQSDAEFIAAAEGVAEIWHLHDSSVRALLTDVLGPLLAKEEQLSQRAAAIAALKQARRDRFAEHGPRLTRKRAGEGQEPAGSDAPGGACANNANNSSHDSSKRRRSLRSSGPPSEAPAPPSPLLNNREQRLLQRQRMKAVTPLPADLNGSSIGEATRMRGSTGSGDDGSTVNGSDGSRATPGVDSLGQQQLGASVSVRSASRRKQQWRPCHAALQ